MVDPEPLRPRFHFTAQTGWLNDPNGLVYHAGEYHLFFQHNPFGTEWGNMTWGHAVSPDLIHWEQLEAALRPYGGHDIFSGSAVVDAEDTAGFAAGPEPPLVALFTHATGPFEQALAYSIDRGRTWTYYKDGAAVIPNLGLDTGERDPRLFWHAPTGRWVMALYVGLGHVRFFASENLRDWTPTGDFHGEDFFECPDLVQLTVEGEPGVFRWVLYDASLRYWVGDFDGERFSAETGPLVGEHGANFYAAQTWTNVPDRVIQIGWMRGGEFPGMPFNQQMSFPCELSLRRTTDGLQLVRRPVPEIAGLYAHTLSRQDFTVNPGENPMAQAPGDLFDLSLDLLTDPPPFSLSVYGHPLTYDGRHLTCLGSAAPLPGGLASLRLILDRTSLEIYARGPCNHADACLSLCFVPRTANPELALDARAPLHLHALTAHTLDV